MSRPRLSICIPTYDRAVRLDSLLESIAGQVAAGGFHEHVEVVVSDNASADATRKIGEKWAGNHPFIRYFRNNANYGGEPNFVISVERARGEFAWVFGDDDRIRETGIAQILDRLHPRTTQLYLNFRCVSPQGDCLSASQIDSNVPDYLKTVDLVRRVGFVSGFALISSHVFERRRFLEAQPKRLLRISPYYILNTALLTAFHDETCHVVHQPLIDYTVGNERLPHENALYVRVLGLLRTLQWLKSAGVIDDEFVFSCRETGANAHLLSTFLREELYGNLGELTNYWALPGRSDWTMIRDFVNHGPSFHGIRSHLREFFHQDFTRYLNQQRPVIHHWRGKAWTPALSILLASDSVDECHAFDNWSGNRAEFPSHESILISTLAPESVSAGHIDTHMSPFRGHPWPSSALSSGLRKALAPRLLLLNGFYPASVKMLSIVLEELSWRTKTSPTLIFNSAASARSGCPQELLGWCVDRRDLVRAGGFENYFRSWSRQRTLADAALRLKSGGRDIHGQVVSSAALRAWYSTALQAGLRTLRRFQTKPLSEHGLNIWQRLHLG